MVVLNEHRTASFLSYQLPCRTRLILDFLKINIITLGFGVALGLRGALGSRAGLVAVHALLHLAKTPANLAGGAVNRDHQPENKQVQQIC